MLSIFNFLEFKIVDFVDIFLVALLLYQLYRLLKGTAAMKIFLGIIAVFFIWKTVDLLEMELLSEIFGQFISVGVIALLVVFQPEIRKFLLMLGTPNFLKKRKFLFWKVFESGGDKMNIDAVVDACKKMSTNLT
ncbi:MAG: TIGR00159 family protein, partial [Bacteroidales bacterium]|nr:TIGR00159 family protein [Bacteroidales bacterium]